MPSGKKQRNKERKKRRYKKLLLEKSRRCRDEQVSIVLDETDVMAHISDNSFHMPISSSPPASEILYDSIDSSVGDFDSTFIKTLSSLEALSFSTPKKDVPTRATKTRRSLSTPSTCYLTPITSFSDEDSISDEMFLICSTNKDSNVNVEAFQFTWLKMVKCTQAFLLSIPSFIFKLCSWLHKLFDMNIRMSSKLEKKDLSIISFKDNNKQTAEDSIELSQNNSKADELILSKLNEILSAMTRLELKHDSLIEKVDKLEQNLNNLKNVPLAVTAAPPPPPPPLPPPPPPPNALMSTPVTRAIRQEKKTSLLSAPSRPSISLQDILGVQLRKTPKPFPLEKEVQSNGSRGPLVSVDMLRSVKLKPSQMRRRSIERPLQSPSAVFKMRSP